MASSDGPAGAVRAVAGGVILYIMVTPNASAPGIQGYNPWRRRLEIRVASPAKRSKANAELVELLADVMGVGRPDVEIVHGGTSHEKSVLIRGVGEEDVLAVLERLLGGGR